MTGGFGLVAWPAHHGASGVMTFVVNQDGVAHEKDLGQDTKTAAAAIRSYDPDSTWRAVEAPVRLP
jgi:hypothetical protein